ncbi:MAG: PhoH family protein [Deltaproteobacteria bacterium]|nr:PhoH family protein [Deltaproteobacteria bacterium]
MSGNPAEKYILDASILLYDPDSIYSYPDAEVVIPLSVIEEIDQFIKDSSEVGRNARLVSQALDQIRQKGSLTAGVSMDNGGILSVFIMEEEKVKLPAFINPHKSSNKVLAAAIMIQKLFPGKTTVVTNDINLRIRVSTIGIPVISFVEKLTDFGKLYQSPHTEELPKETFKKLKNKGFLVPEEGKYYANQQVVFQRVQTNEKIVCRYFDSKKRFIPIRNFPKGVWGIYPKNQEQEIALDLLMDPEIHIVILAGKAGTGKTLLALAAALEMMLTSGQYHKILVSRPIFPMGRDMGYLPGDIEEKMAPWMQPVFDNLEFLTAAQGKSGGKSGSYQRLLESGLIELEPLTYIRGRSIPNRFMIVDEAQNLTPHEIKTIVTRAGTGTKVVLTGDPYQIDNPYIQPTSNGLSYVIEKMREFELAGHINLMCGVRSKLAELASNVL